MKKAKSTDAKRRAEHAHMDRFIASVELLTNVSRVFDSYPDDVADAAKSVLQPDLQQISKTNAKSASLPRKKVLVDGKLMPLTKAMLEEHRAEFIRKYKKSRGEVEAACIKFNISKGTRNRFLNSE